MIVSRSAFSTSYLKYNEKKKTVKNYLKQQRIQVTSFQMKGNFLGRDVGFDTYVGVTVLLFV